MRFYSLALVLLASAAPGHAQNINVMRPTTDPLTIGAIPYATAASKVGDSPLVRVNATTITVPTMTVSVALTAPTLDTGQGANELYPMNQGVRSLDSPTFVNLVSTSFNTGTINTGQGNNEVYPMDQGVLTTDSPTFNVLTSVTFNTDTLNVGTLNLTNALATAAYADNSITYAKLQNVTAASRLLGRGSAAGAGDPEELTIGAGLALTGTVLSATASGGDVVGPAASTDNALARYDATTGKLLQDSTGALLSDNMALTLNGATITASEPALKASQTWNSAGVVFTADLVNVTNTASSSASLLWDRQVGGVSQGKLDRGGILTTTGAIVSASHVQAGGGSYFTFGTSRSRIGSTADGVVLLANQAVTGFTKLQLGVDDASPGTLVSIQAASGVGTDIAAQPVSLDGGAGTGTGAGGDVTLRTAPSFTATGSTAGTPVDRVRVAAKGKVLTDASAVSLFEIALPTLTMTGGKIEAMVVCTDGTDMQSFSQSISFTALNKGGAYTTDIDVYPTDLVSGLGAKSVSGGSTLTTTWTVLNGTDKVTIQLSADTSLTPSSNAFRVYYTVFNNSGQAITIL